MDLERRSKGGPRVTKSHMSSLESDLDAYHNAKCWVHSLFNPFRGACHFPEPCTEGTDVSSLVLKGASCNSITYAGTAGTGSHMNVTVFNANLKDYRRCPTSATAPNAITWAAGSNHPKKASLDDIVASYRVTSFGIRFYNTGKILNRSGRLYVGRLPPQLSSTAPATTLYDLISTSEDVVSVDLADLRGEGYTVFWIPVTTQGMLSSAAHGASTGTFVSSGLGFRAPGDNAMDNRIFAFAIWDGDVTDNTLTYDHVMNIETIPHTEDQYLFDSKAVVGSEDAVTRAFSAGIRAIERNDTLWNTVKTGVTEGAVHLLHGFDKAVRFAEGLSAGAPFGMLSSRMVNVPHPALRRKRRTLSALDPVEEKEERAGIQPPPPSPAPSSTRYVYVRD